jgi:ABC-type multidrug transport system ATPase subunit
MIETNGLRKSFRSRAGRETKVVEAVRGVDLSVKEGEIFGFLGLPPVDLAVVVPDKSGHRGSV